MAAELGIRIARARTVETHPAIIEMIAEMLETAAGTLRGGVLSGAREARRPVQRRRLCLRDMTRRYRSRFGMPRALATCFTASMRGKP